MSTRLSLSNAGPLP